jgi:hypothetical protein
MPFITYESKLGTPIQAGRVKLVPVSRVLQITPPGSHAGFIWNHPTAVQVVDEQGEVEILPIQDVTLQAVILLTVVSLLFGLITSMIRHNNRVEKGEH